MNCLRFKTALVGLGVLFVGVFVSSLPAQTTDEASTAKKIITTGDTRTDDFRQELEPGVVVYGKSHRFAEVGQCQGFDSSPDGRTLVFATSKLKFFDLEENKVTDTAGKASEHYNGVIYSPDGRLVFAHSYGNGQGFVRVFDAIDMSTQGTISTAIEEAEEGSRARNHFYIQYVCVSPDANYIALSNHNEVQVRDVRNGELISRISDLGYVQGMAFSPDETELYVPKMGQLAVVDIETGETKKRSDSKLVGQHCNALDVNLSRNLLAMPASTSVSLFDLEQQTSAGSIPLPKRVYGQSVQFSDDGSLIAVVAWQQDSGTSKMVTIILDVDTKQVVKTVGLPSQGVTRMRFSSDNRNLLVSGHGIYGVMEVSLQDKEIADAGSYPVGPAKTAAIHPDGKSFLTGSQGGEVTWFDAESGKVLRTVQKPNLRNAQIMNDGDDVLLVSQWGNQDGIARFSYKTGKIEKSYHTQAAAKKGNVFSQIKNFMTSKNDMSRHSQAYAIAARLSADGSELYSVMMDMSYKQIQNGLSVTMEQEMTVRFVKMDAETGKKIESVKVNPEDLGFSKNEWIQVAGIRPDGSEFAVARGNKIYAVDAQTGELIADYSPDKATQIQRVEYSPEGRFIAAASHRGVTIWDASSSELAHDVVDRGAQHFSFSKDGTRLAVSPRGRTSMALVYDTENWKTIMERKDTAADRSCIALSDDGQKLLFGLTDCRVEVWDLAKVDR